MNKLDIVFKKLLHLIHPVLKLLGIIARCGVSVWPLIQTTSIGNQRRVFIMIATVIMIIIVIIIIIAIIISSRSISSINSIT